jgi:hypothetical protein
MKEIREEKQRKKKNDEIRGENRVKCMKERRREKNLSERKREKPRARKA